MDLIALAIPFFLLLLVLEITLDRVRKTHFYRLNDAINSLSVGTLSTLFGYVTKLLPLAIYGLVLQHLAVFKMELAWFDFSARGIALWLLALLAWDFCYYWAHRYGHEMSVLWAAHAIHHQSEDYNLSTALRQTSTGFIFGWIFFVPLFIAGFPLQVIIAVNAIDLIYQFWVHTQHIQKLGWFDRVFVSPSNHRVHHAQNARYIDKNYGGILILWDRLFGTFQEELDDDPVIFGVRKPLANWNPLWANLQVYAYLLFDARHATQWKDKLGLWFRRTGWRPADVESRYPKRPHPLPEFHKFDPAIPRGLGSYILSQFLIATAWGLWMGGMYSEYGLGAIAIPGLILVAALHSFGLLTEGRAAARRFELLRLGLLTPVGILLTAQTGLLPLNVELVTATLIYSVVSVTWFRRRAVSAFAT